MRRSACFITLFSVCSLQRVKSLIIYPDIPLAYKVATQPSFGQATARGFKFDERYERAALMSSKHDEIGPPLSYRRTFIHAAVHVPERVAITKRDDLIVQRGFFFDFVVGVDFATPCETRCDAARFRAARRSPSGNASRMFFGTIIVRRLFNHFSFPSQSTTMTFARMRPSAYSRAARMCLYCKRQFGRTARRQAGVPSRYG